MLSVHTEEVFLRDRASRGMDCMLANHFQSLSCRGKTLCEYVWLGSLGSDLRSATKVLNFKPSTAAEVPLWTYDGAATGQESASCSVVYLKPRSIHPDPLRCVRGWVVSLQTRQGRQPHCG